jgi:pimeloyl-ACP methyl ester carboxylesterase
MQNKIAIPVGSSFDRERSIELMHLIDRVYSCYEYEINPDQQNITSPIVIEDGISYIMSTSQYGLVDPSFKDPANSHLPLNATAGKVFEQYKIIDVLRVDERNFPGNRDRDRRILTMGFILQKDQNFYIIFRGTREVAEWIQNAEFNQTELPFANFDLGKISAGFSEIYTVQMTDEPATSIEQQIEQFISDNVTVLTQAQANVFIAGHSLGGALAGIAAAHVNYCCERVQPIVYTFASPRVGNVKFNETIVAATQAFYRVVNTEDIVNNLPMATLEFFGPEMKPQPDKRSAAKAALEPAAAESLAAAPYMRSQEESFGLVEVATIFKNILKGMANRPLYCHLGETITFTHQTGFVSTNHNLFVTYGNAIRE